MNPNISDFSEVPYCRINQIKKPFPRNQARSKSAEYSSSEYIFVPDATKFAQVKERNDYSNKVLKQLESINVKPIEEEQEEVRSNPPLSFHEVSPTRADLERIVDDTLVSLNDSMSDTEDTLSDWNPMKDAYEQKCFNSYQVAKYDDNIGEKYRPVRGTRISPAKGNTEEVTLYVSSIPLSLTENGLKNMFSRFGRCKIKKCKPKIPDSKTTFGFVTYSSVKNAEMAICEYNGFSFGENHQLKVKLSYNYANEGSYVPRSEDAMLGPKHYRQSTDSGLSSSDKENEKSTSSPQYNNDTRETNEASKNSSSTDERSDLEAPKTPRMEKKQPSPNSSRSRPRLFIQGIPVYFTEKKLESLLMAEAKCYDCMVVGAKKGTQITTYGFASFDNVETAEKIIEVFNGFPIGKYNLKLTYSNISAKQYGSEIPAKEEDEYYNKLYDDLDPSFTEASRSTSAQTQEKQQIIALEESTPQSELKIQPDMISEMNKVETGSENPGTVGLEEKPSQTGLVEEEKPISFLRKEIKVIEEEYVEWNSKFEFNEKLKKKDQAMAKSTCANAIRGMLLNDFPVKPFPDEANFVICCTEVVSPNLFYGQLFNKDSLLVLEELRDRLATENYKNDSHFTPKIHEICVAKFDEDGQWYRGCVMQYNTDKTATVFFIDFGNKADVYTSNLRCINESLLKHPQMALKFSLNGVHPIEKNWSPDVQSRLTSLLTSGLTTVTNLKIDGDIMRCTAVNSDDVDIAKYLILNRLAQDTMEFKQDQKRTSQLASVQITSVNSSKPNTDLNSETVQHDSSEALFVAPVFPSESTFSALITWVESPSLLYAQLATEKNKEKLISMNCQLKDLFESAPASSFHPSVDKMYIAFHDEYQDYYRVIVEMVHDNIAICFLLDYGEKMEFSCSKLRYLRQDLFNIPAFALPLVLAHIQPYQGMEWTQEATTALRSLDIYSQINQVKVLKQCNGKLYVKVTCGEIDFSSYLISKNLAKRATQVSSVTTTTTTATTTTTTDNHDNSILSRRNDFTSSKERPNYSGNSTSMCSIDRYTNLSAFTLSKDIETIVVSHVESLNCIFVQVAIDFVAKTLSGITEEISTFCEHHKSDTSLPVARTLCCAIEEGCWYRGYVLRVHTDEADIFFIDFGNTNTVKFSDIRPLYKSLSLCNSTPSLAIPCKMHNPSQRPVNSQMVLKFKDSCLNKLSKIRVSDSSVDPIEVEFLEIPLESLVPREEEPRNVESKPEPVVVNQTLIGKSTQKHQKIMLTEMRKVVVPGSGVIAVVHVDSLHSFYGQLLELTTLQKLENLTVEMSEMLGRDGFYTPIVGEMCAAYFPSYDQFFRVSVISIDAIKQIVEVQSVDYGNVSSIPFSDVAPLPRRFADFPMQAVKLSLFGIPDNGISGECTRFFQDLSMNKQSYYVVKETSSDCYFIQLSIQGGRDINELLRVKKLLPGFSETINTQMDSTSILRTNTTTPTDTITQSTDVEVPEQNGQILDKYTKLPLLPMPDGEMECMTVHVNNLEDFYVQVETKESLNAMTTITDMLGEYSLDPPNEVSSLLKHTLCCCLDEGQWFRAYVLDVFEFFTAKVFFIDYGNVSELSLHDIRPCSQSISTIPSLALHCRLSNVGSIRLTQATVIKQFETLVLNKITKLRVKQQYGDIFEVDLIGIDNESVRETLEKFSASIEISEKLQQQQSTIDVLSQQMHQVLIQQSDEIEYKQSSPYPEPTQNELISADCIPSTSHEPSTDHTQNQSKCDKIGTGKKKMEIDVAISGELNESRETIFSPASTIPEVTPNYTPIKTQEVARETQTEASFVGGKFQPSCLPSTIHPLDSVALKMEVSGMMGGTYTVQVNHIESPHLMYATFANMQQELLKLSEDMRKFFTSYLSAQNYIFKSGTICAVVDEEIWKRAVLLEVAENVSQIFFIDFGQKKTVDNKNIRPLINQFNYLPAQCIPLKLFSVKPRDCETQWSEKAVEFLRDRLLKSTVKVKPKYKEKNILFGVRMKIDGQLVDELMESHDLAQKVEPELLQISSTNRTSNKNIPLSDISDLIEFEKPPEKFEGYVSCPVSPYFFYVCINDDEKQKIVDGFDRELRKMYGSESTTIRKETAEHHKFSSGELCVVFNDDKWYRAYVLSLNPNESGNVWLLDYGTKLIIPNHKIYALPAHMKRLRAQAITAQLRYIIVHEGKEYNAAAKKRFKDLVTDRLLSIHVVKVHGMIHRVNLYDKVTGIDIAKQLVDDGFASYNFKGDNQTLHQQAASQYSPPVYPPPRNYANYQEKQHYNQQQQLLAAYIYRTENENTQRPYPANRGNASLLNAMMDGYNNNYANGSSARYKNEPDRGVSRGNRGRQRAGRYTGHVHQQPQDSYTSEGECCYSQHSLPYPPNCGSFEGSSQDELSNFTTNGYQNANDLNRRGCHSRRGRDVMRGSRGGRGTRCGAGRGNMRYTRKMSPERARRSPSSSSSSERKSSRERHNENVHSNHTQPSGGYRKYSPHRNTHHQQSKQNRLPYKNEFVEDHTSFQESRPNYGRADQLSNSSASRPAYREMRRGRHTNQL